MGAAARPVRTLAAVATLVVALAGCSALQATEDEARTPSAESAPTATPSPSFGPSATSTAPAPTQTPDPSPTPAATTVLAAGDEGDEVRELQSRLKQIQWYAPAITGDYDEATQAAVSGFQDKRGLPAEGSVDEQTWDRLQEMTRTPTDDEMHNRIVAGPTIIGQDDDGDRVRELQARLKQVAWFAGDVTTHYGDVTRTAVAGFQTKRGIPSTGEVDQRTWDRLLAMTRQPTDDELQNRVAVSSTGTSAALDARCRTGRAVCIDKSSRTLRWVVDGTVQKTMDVRFGSEYTPTREGQFSVGWKSRDHVSKLYGSSMPYAMFFSGGQAVHYSSDFAARGYAGASHGCVNVRDRAGVAALFDQVGVGDKVVVYRS